MDSRRRETLGAARSFRRGRDDGRASRSGNVSRQDHELFERRNGGSGIEAKTSRLKRDVVPSKVGTFNKRNPSDELTGTSGALVARVMDDKGRIRAEIVMGSASGDVGGWG